MKVLNGLVYCHYNDRLHQQEKLSKITSINNMSL